MGGRGGTRHGSVKITSGGRGRWMKSCLKRKKTRGTRSETLLDTSTKERVELSSLDPMGDGHPPLRQQSHINLCDTWCAGRTD